MDDLIRRKDAIEVIKAMVNVSDSHDRYLLAKVWDQLKGVLSADHCADEWCTDCKEYDNEKKCCPRFNRVIRNTVQRPGRWVIIDHPFIHGYCSACGWEANYYEDDVVGMKYCPNCGARMVNGD